MTLSGFYPELPGAACADDGPADHIWFSDIGTREAVEAARAICADCPVAAQCLEYALGVPSLEGIWAGTTVRQRADMRLGRTPGVPLPPKRERPDCGTTAGYARHRRLKEKTCARCRRANADYQQAVQRRSA